MAVRTNAAIVKEHCIWSVPAFSFIKNKVMWSGSIRGAMRTIPDEDNQRMIARGASVGDIRLFSTTGPSAIEFTGSSVQLEKSLQTHMKQNLEALFGVTFLKYKRDQVKVNLEGYLKTLGYGGVNDGRH